MPNIDGRIIADIDSSVMIPRDLDVGNKRTLHIFGKPLDDRAGIVSFDLVTLQQLKSLVNEEEATLYTINASEVNPGTLLANIALEYGLDVRVDFISKAIGHITEGQYYGSSTKAVKGLMFRTANIDGPFHEL